MILMFVRHGVTDWNIQERFQGQLDVPLSNVGCLQAEVLKRHLAGVAFDAIYSSPLRRAYQTAHVIAGRNRILTDWRLAERHHGIWQGRRKQEIALRWPDLWERWDKQPISFTPQGGECAMQVQSRVQDFLQSIEGKTVLCVSHGVVIQTARSILLGTSYADNIRDLPRNASVHTFYVGRNQVDYCREDVL